MILPFVGWVSLDILLGALIIGGAVVGGLLLTAADVPLPKGWANWKD